ncbi:MAG TPA: LamG domain-containing protein [Vicinamibacterales bacterium]
MADTSDIDAALVMKLQNDAQLLAVMPNGVYMDQGPADSTRLVLVTQTSAEDTNGFDGRAFEELRYQVKAVALADPRIASAVAAANSAVRTAAARIDVVLHRQDLAATGYRSMLVERERRVRNGDPDMTAPGDVFWYYRGGVYYVAMSPHDAPAVDPYRTRVLADGALAYWPLSETTGTTAEDAAGTRHGTISGDVTLGAPGVGAGQTSVDWGAARTGRIDCPALPPCPEGFTLEAWCYPTGPAVLPDWASYTVLASDISTAGGVRLQLDQSAGYLQPWLVAAMAEGGALEDGFVGLNVWTHVVITHNGTTCTAYVDGVAVQAGDWAVPALAVGNGPLTIGWQAADATVGWLGRLQDVAIYPRALTATEIADHYALRRPV